jgi:hypothetical protein
MKSPSNTQNTSDNNLTNPSNSIRLAALSNSNVVDTPSVLPTSTRTNNTSSPAESEAVRRERLRVFLEFAIAVIDSFDDFDPIDSSTTHKSPQQ